MDCKTLISLTAIFIAATAAINVNAQDITPKKYSVGPAIEFSGNGTSFGIQGKVNVIPNFSVRPIILFGYQPGVSFPVSQTFTPTSGLSNDAIALYQLSQCANQNIQFCSAPGSLGSAAGKSTSTTITNLVPSGTAYGLAVTYDFTFTNSKISGYVGPRVLFVSASGDVESVNVNANQTNIGLIAGVDYAISDKLSAGLNATYDFSRSGSYTAKGYVANSPLNGTFPLSGGGSFNIGVNVGYSF